LRIIYRLIHPTSKTALHIPQCEADSCLVCIAPVSSTFYSIFTCCSSSKIPLGSYPAILSHCAPNIPRQYLCSARHAAPASHATQPRHGGNINWSGQTTHIPSKGMSQSKSVIIALQCHHYRRPTMSTRICHTKNKINETWLQSPH
jgi:hypothetical protein